MKITLEIDTDLAFENDAEEIVNEILLGGIDMLNHSPDIKECISWRILKQGPKEWDEDGNI